MNPAKLIFLTTHTTIKPIKIMELKLVPQEPIESTDSARLLHRYRHAIENPRDIQSSMENVVKMTTINPDFADLCMYAKPNREGDILGPSIRFAEILAMCWKNNESGGRVIRVEEKSLTAQGIFTDFESNVSYTIEVERGIWSKGKNGNPGRRYSDSMIVVTGNAAISIAIRNAIYKGIPQAFWDYTFEQVKKVALTLKSNREELVRGFQKLGLSKSYVLGKLGVKEVKELTNEHCLQLRAIGRQIKNGEMNADDAFETYEARSTMEALAFLDTFGNTPVKASAPAFATLPPVPDQKPNAKKHFTPEHEENEKKANQKPEKQIASSREGEELPDDIREAAEYLSLDISLAAPICLGKDSVVLDQLTTSQKEKIISKMREALNMFGKKDVKAFFDFVNTYEKPDISSDDKMRGMMNAFLDSALS